MDYIGLGCCALAIALYLNTLGAGFVYDDSRAILRNPDVVASTPLGQLLHNDFWGTRLTDSGSHGSYRPLCVASFKLNHAFGGFRPAGYHAVNMLLHCAATALVVRLARVLLATRWSVAAAGALFAVHPVHTEAVAGIVGRADLMACNLYLLALLAYVKHVALRERGERGCWTALGTTIVAAVAAMLSKETGATALVMCGVYDAVKALSGCRDKHRMRSLSILGIALATILQLRLMLPTPQTHFSTADNPVAKSASLLTRTLTFGYLPVFNLQLLLYPAALSFDWGMDAIPMVSSPADPRNLLTIAVYALLAHICWTIVRRMRSKKLQPHRTPVPATLKRLSRLQQQQLTAQPHNQQHQQRKPVTVAVITSALADFSAAAHCVCSICKQGLNLRHTSRCRAQNNNNGPPAAGPPCECPPFRHPSPTPSASSSSSASSTSSRHSNKSNKSTSSTSSSASTSSSSASTHGGLSSMAARRCPPERATVLLCLALMVLSFLPASNLFVYVGFVVAERILYLPSVGFCLLVGLGFGRLVGRRRGLLRGRRRARLAVMACAAVLLAAGAAKTMQRNLDWRDEESLYRSAIRINPPKALGNLGSVLSSHGRYDDAKAALQLALRYRPNMADVHYNLGVIFQKSDDFKGAVDCFQKAIHFRPSLALAYLNLGTSLIALGRCQEAAAVLHEGAQLEGVGLRDRSAHDTARVSALLQLGGLYSQQGKLHRAVAVYREALHILPDSYAPYGIYNRLGDALSRLHKWSEAERFHQAALEGQPADAATYVSYGAMLARNSSRASEAELWFKRALKLAPSDASVRHHYAEFLSSVARHAEACEQRCSAAELAPTDYSLVTAAATALRLANRNVEAIKWYRTAVTLRPDEARSHMNLGAMYHLLGQTAPAVASYREALRLQPGDRTTLANLVKLGVSEVS